MKVHFPLISYGFYHFKGLRSGRSYLLWYTLSKVYIIVRMMNRKSSFTYRTDDISYDRRKLKPTPLSSNNTASLSRLLLWCFKSLGLFLSGDIMVFDFLHFVFFQVQYIHYCWKHYVEISTYFLWKSLTEKRIRRLALSVLR